MSTTTTATTTKSNNSTRQTVVLDSLPYIDPVQDDYEQYALALIEEEMSKTRPPAERKPKEIHFRTSLLQAHYEKRKTEGPLPTFTEEPVRTPPEGATAQDWNQAVRQARTAYEKERIRGILLQIDDVGKQWKEHNDMLSKEFIMQQQSVMRQRQAVEQINLRRQQTQQQQNGHQLQALETQYRELLTKQFQLKNAIAEMQE
jgi:hypothetical protein